ncbi:hypothetical protein [Mesorhizobium sp. M0088]|uniref:hypothetical protein n=1 Tax=Mesorhizobium sp. M0088 TaxID=2956873 RepID=UPI00333C6656
MKTDIENRKYVGTKIPKGARIATIELDSICVNILEETYALENAPTADFPNGEILVPKTLDYRLIPGDLELRDDEDGYDDERVFDDFFEKTSVECFYWNAFGKIDKDIIFLAPYSSENRLWMMNARFKDNIGITSVGGEFSIVGDIFMRYCIVAGSRYFIEQFDNAWGGVDKIKSDFVTYVTSMPRPENKEWALKYLVPLLEKYETS